MKQTVITLLSVMWATSAFPCVKDVNVEASRIDALPVIAFIEPRERKNEVAFVVYVRDTGNFEGLTLARCDIKTADGSSLFGSVLSRSETTHEGLYRFSFQVGATVLDRSEFTVIAEKDDKHEVAGTSGATVAVHTCLYIYRFNLQMLYQQYRQNDLFKHTQLDKYEGKELNTFLKRSFINDRENSRSTPGGAGAPSPHP